MRILLLNENPVVNKLVTLSAKKTSDELDSIANVEEIEGSSYDLLVLDDTCYTEDVIEHIKQKTSFSKSLYICSKDAKEVDGFTSILKKPFLPTDLVELFSSLSKDVVAGDIEEDSFSDHAISLDDSLTLDEDLDDELEDELSFDDDLDDDKLVLDHEELSLEDEIEDLDLSLNEDDKDLSLDELSEGIDEDESSESVLDEEEVQEVQNLLDETSEDEELSLDDEEELSLEDEIEDEELSLDEDEELSLEDEIEDEELSLDEDEELSLEDENLEAQIQNAVEELSEEELESELDEETLMSIATSDIDSIDDLTSRDLKIAMGEEVDELPEEEIVENSENEIEEIAENIPSSQEITPDNEGVESLKKLLHALSNEDVAASLKGMKININISLGDK